MQPQREFSRLVIVELPPDLLDPLDDVDPLDPLDAVVPLATPFFCSHATSAPLWIIGTTIGW